MYTEDEILNNKTKHARRFPISEHEICMKWELTKCGRCSLEERKKHFIEALSACKRAKNENPYPNYRYETLLGVGWSRDDVERLLRAEVASGLVYAPDEELEVIKNENLVTQLRIKESLKNSGHPTSLTEAKKQGIIDDTYIGRYEKRLK